MHIDEIGAAWAKAQNAADVALAASWTAHRVGNDQGVDRLEAAFDSAAAAADGLAEIVAELKPQTAAEAAIKFKILLARYGDGDGGFDDAEPIFAFLTDLEELAARETTRQVRTGFAEKGRKRRQPPPTGDAPPILGLKTQSARTAPDSARFGARR